MTVKLDWKEHLHRIKNLTHQAKFTDTTQNAWMDVHMV